MKKKNLSLIKDKSFSQYTPNNRICDKNNTNFSQWCRCDRFLYISSSPTKKSYRYILKKANVRVCLDHNITESFDVYLDCCGEMVNAKKPTLGTVELTRTGTYVYKKAKVDYPIVSVDDSKLKYLEAIGTGDACKKAISELTNQDITNKKFIIFGFGKIGRGIVRSLKLHTKDIVVVEKNPNILSFLKQSNIKSISLDEGNKIRGELKNSFCAITATAVTNCISNHFDKKDFKGVHLANMGAVDEFGEKFKPSEVLYKKNPINFSIKEPTTMRFLDPVFYAHNKAIDLLLSKKLPSGYHSFSDTQSCEIIKKWKNFHNQAPLFPTNDINMLIQRGYF